MHVLLHGHLLGTAGPKCVGLHYSDSSQQNKQHNRNPNGRIRHPLGLFSVFVSSAYVENYKVRSRESDGHITSVYCSYVKHSVH